MEYPSEGTKVVVSLLSSPSGHKEVETFFASKRARAKSRCLCDDVVEKEGTSAFLEIVEDLPNWTSWFGEQVFTWFLHAAIRARNRGLDLTYEEAGR